MSQTKSQLINPIDGNINVTGIVTANNVNVTGIVTSITVQATNTRSTNINATGIVTASNINVTGIVTANNVIAGAARTTLVVLGDARITGILTVGTSSLTFDGKSDRVTIGTGVTIQSGVISATSYFASSNRRVVALTAGDTTLWHQAAAPVGWTKLTTHNNKALRVVSGVGGGSGGTTAFTTVFASRTPGGSVSVSGSNSGGSIANTTSSGSVSGSNSGGSVSNTTLTTTQIPSHSHPFDFFTGSHRDGGGVNFSLAVNQGNTTYNTSNSGGGTAHNHGFTNPSWSGSISMNAHNHTFTNPTWSGSASFSGSSMDFAVQYIDMIVCSID